MTRARPSRRQFLGQYNLTGKKEEKDNKAMHIFWYIHYNNRISIAFSDPTVRGGKYNCSEKKNWLKCSLNNIKYISV